MPVAAAAAPSGERPADTDEVAEIPTTANVPTAAVKPAILHARALEPPRAPDKLGSYDT